MTVKSRPRTCKNGPIQATAWLQAVSIDRLIKFIAGAHSSWSVANILFWGISNIELDYSYHISDCPLSNLYIQASIGDAPVPDIRTFRVGSRARSSRHRAAQAMWRGGGLGWVFHHHHDHHHHHQLDNN